MPERNPRGNDEVGCSLAAFARIRGLVASGELAPATEAIEDLSEDGARCIVFALAVAGDED